MTAQVVIDDIIPRTQLTATASQTVFNTNWTADVATDIEVYARASGVEPDDATQLVSSSLYNVTFVGVTRTVRVTFLSGRTVNDVITIIRNTPAERTNLYINSNFLPSMLNQDFGILTLVDQQAQMFDTVINPGYNKSATILDKDKILPILGANQIWAMNPDNDEIIVYNVPASGGVAPNNATYILQVADSELANAQALGDLDSGIMIATTTTGVVLSRILTGTSNQITIANGSGIVGNPTVSITPNPVIPGTAGMGIPQGTTAQRVTPSSGIGLRYNTEIESLEFWTGSTWTQIEDSTDLSTILAMLASHTAGEGSALIGLQDQGSVSSKTVQELANATIIAQTDNGTLANGQFLSALATGFTYVTTTSGVLASRIITGTVNQVDVANGSGSGGAPTFSISSTLNLPGSFNIQSSNAITSIINDSSMNTATSSNISTSAAIKAYVDSLVTGLNIQGSCVCASTTALTVTYSNGTAGVGATLTNAGAQAAITLDGVSPTVGQRVLIKNQASSLQNGIYTVTTVGSGASNWVLTRATDYDTPTEVQPGDLVVLTGGTTQSQSSWLETATVTAIGTDPITFVQFTASLPVNVPSGGTGVTSFTAYAPVVGGTTTTGSLQSVTLGASGTLYQSAGVGALPGFTTATYPSTAGTSGNVMVSDGTNWTSAAASTLSPLTTKGDLYTFSTVNARLAVGTTNGNMLQVSSGAATGIAWSTATYPSTTTINQVLFSSSNNVIAGISAVNSAVMVSSAGGVPSFSTTLPSGLTIPGYATTAASVSSITGTANQVIASASTGAVVLSLPQSIATSSAVQFGSITFTTTSGIIGTTTNDNAAAGSVGQYIDSGIVGPTNLASSGVAQNITSISLTAGDWDVDFACLIQNATTVTGVTAVSLSTTSATLNATTGLGNNLSSNTTTGAYQPFTGFRRISVASTTTVYIVAVQTFSVGNPNATAQVAARRAR